MAPRKKYNICREDDKKTLRIIKSIFFFVVLASAMGTGLFLYYMIGSVMIDNSLHMIDGTKPPYTGIIFIAMLMASMIGYLYILQLSKNLCD